MASANHSKTKVKLARQINLPLLVLYGLSVTVGAGIYVLIGESAARAGQHAPLAFLIAGVLVALSAASYAELSGRFPVSAGEAAYVDAATTNQWLPFAVGLLVCAAGLFSSATVLRGGAGYVQEFVAAPAWLIAVVTGLAIGAIAAWGIRQSVWTTAILAVVEIGFLFAIAIMGTMTAPVLPTFFEAFTPSDLSIAFGLSSAVLLAFFAFIGFEDMVNVAEEVQNPGRNLPLAIALTLIITTLLYITVVTVALSVALPSELAESRAPLALVYQRLFGAHSSIVSAIAIAAIINGVLVQTVMVSRVLYGMSRLGRLPSILGIISPKTQTPLHATAITIAVTLILTLIPQTAILADLTSTFTLLVFASINYALWHIKRNDTQTHADVITVPIWCPVAGLVVSVLFLFFEWSSRLEFFYLGWS
ncbi:MAG: amino acid permease [Pseudomonadota bacterium]